MHEPDFKITLSDPRTQGLVKLLQFSEHQPLHPSKELFYLKTQLFVSALAQEMERIQPLAFEHSYPESCCGHLKRRVYKHKYRDLEKIRDACITMVKILLSKKASLEKKDAAIKKFAHITLGSWLKTSLKILAIAAISAASAFLGFMVGAAISFGVAGIPGAVIGLKTGLSAITALTLTESIGAGVGGAVGAMASSIGFFHKDTRQVQASFAIAAAKKWINPARHP